MTNISIFNVLGQHVLTSDLSKANETVEMSQLNSGVYIVRLAVGNTTKTFKVLKQ